VVSGARSGCGGGSVLASVEAGGDGWVPRGTGHDDGVQLAQQARRDRDAGLGVGERVVRAAGEVGVAGGQDRVVS
jgi:hypothetical protein